MVATLIMANPPKTRAERARLAAARLRSRASRPAGMSMLHKTAKLKSNPAKKAPSAAQRAARERFKAMVAARRQNPNKTKRTAAPKMAPVASAPRAPEKKMAKKTKKKAKKSGKRKVAKKVMRKRRAKKSSAAPKRRKSRGKRKSAAPKRRRRRNPSRKRRSGGRRRRNPGKAKRKAPKGYAQLAALVKKTAAANKAARASGRKVKYKAKNKINRLRLRVMKAHMSPSLAALAKKHGLRSNPDGMLGQLKALLPEIAVGMIAFGIASVGAHKLAPKVVDKAPEMLKKWVPTMLAVGLGGVTFFALSKMGGKAKMAAPFALAAGAAAGMMHAWTVKGADGVAMGTKLGLPIALGDYVVGDYHMGNYVLGQSPDFTVGNYVLGSPGEQFYIQGADDGIFAGIEHQNARRLEAPADAMQRHNTRRDVEGVLSGADDGIFA